MAGLRVVRSGEGKDGREGRCGTTTGSHSKAGWINVLWDNGRRSDCRSGANDAFHLLVLDNGPSGVFHPGIKCDACDELHVKGLRWKCLECPNYDLCTKCYGDDKHDCKHKFKRIDLPSTKGTDVGRRMDTVKLQSWGLYRGATVVRGENWNKDNQDGGLGSVGTITKIGYVTEESFDKAALVVQWPHNTSQSYIYRRGLGGKVDVKYKTAAKGWYYYRDHLPQLRDAAALAKKTPTTGKSPDVDDFIVDDYVQMIQDVKEIKRLQVTHGGWNDHMTFAMPHVGRVMKVDENGDVKVNFNGKNWTFNPAVCRHCDPATPPTQQTPSTTNRLSGDDVGASSSGSSQTGNFSVGDLVKVAVSLGQLKFLQNQCGGYREEMSELVSATGLLSSITGEGNLVVKFSSGNFIMNPKTCVSLDVTKNKVQNTQGSDTRHFEQGDFVKIALPEDSVEEHQYGHGGWNKTMAKALEKVGVVQSVESSGDLSVKFGTYSWTFNPVIFERVEHDVGSKRKSRRGPGKYECGICLEGDVTIVFNCGHTTCDQCSKKIEDCHICRNPIALRTKMFLT